MLLLLPPLGLILMWTRRPGWGRGWNFSLTGVWVILVVLIVVAGASGGAGNSSKAMQDDILSSGASQIQSSVNAIAPNASATVKINDANCIQTAGTQTYTCIAHYTVNAPSVGLNDQKYALNISGTCDSSGNCQWHADSAGAPVGK